VLVAVLAFAALLVPSIEGLKTGRCTGGTWSTASNPGSLMNAGNVVLLMPALRDRGPGWGRLGL